MQSTEFLIPLLKLNFAQYSTLCWFLSKTPNWSSRRFETITAKIYQKCKAAQVRATHNAYNAFVFYTKPGDYLGDFQINHTDRTMTLLFIEYSACPYRVFFSWTNGQFFVAANKNLPGRPITEQKFFDRFDHIVKPPPPSPPLCKLQ